MTVQHSSAETTAFSSNPENLLDQVLTDAKAMQNVFTPEANKSNPWVQVDMGTERTIVEVQVRGNIFPLLFISWHI